MLPLLVPSVQAAVSEPRDPSSGVAPITAPGDGESVSCRSGCSWRGAVAVRLCYWCAAVTDAPYDGIWMLTAAEVPFLCPPECR